MRSWALGALALASCTIIIDGGGDTNPVPIPVPLQCDVGATAPKLHVLFAVRLERSTVNLVELYRGLMEQTVAGLAGAGFQVDEVALMRLGERERSPVLLAAWGCTLDSPEQLDVGEVLRHYALQDEAQKAPDRCTSAPVIQLGRDLSEVVTRYPPGLGGTSGRSAFGAAPDQVLMVHLDALGRTVGMDSSACEASALYQEGSMEWLDYAGDNPRLEAVTHWFFTTDEGVDRGAFTGRCSNIEGFPVNVLDALEESQLPYYGPLQDAILGAGGNAASLPLCEALIDVQRRAFLEAQVTALAERAGLEVNKEQLDKLLDEGLDGLADRLENNDMRE